MVISFKKSSCLRIGSRHDAKCADILSSSGCVIPWVKETRYLATYMVLLSMAKRSFYKAANAILGKIGGKASEEVILQLVRTKCMPVLLYGLEACPLRNIDVVNYCRMQFNFDLPSVTIAQRSRKFADKYRLCDNALCKSFVFR